MGRKYKVLRKEVDALRAEIASLRKLVTGKGAARAPNKPTAAAKKGATPAKKIVVKKIIKSRPLARAVTPKPVHAEQPVAVVTAGTSLE